MKKRFLGLLTFILAIVMVFSLSGCNLFTIDSDRDSNQVVAEVNIVKKHEIKKYDLMLGYMNYGYYYVQYYGYTQDKVMQMVLDNIINTNVILQNAMVEFEDGEAPFENCIIDSSKAKYDYDRYLTEDEIRDATYNVYEAVNQYLDTYLEEETLSQDTFNGTVRTVPTDASNNKEKTSAEKDAYISAGFDVNSTPNHSKSFNKFIKFLKANNFLGEDYDGTIQSTEFYKASLEGEKENIIYTNYQKILKKNAIKNLAYSDIQALYLEELSKQQNFNNTEFVEALTSASASAPVLYSAYGTYGYVYNLLLGANGTQTSQISALTEEKDSSEYELARNEILKSLTVSDLRDSWINSGYDFDFDSKKFTGDYTFAKIKENEGDKVAKNSLPFEGSVTVIKEDDEKPEFRAVSDSKTLNEFIEYMTKYVYGQGAIVPTEEKDNNVYREYNSSAEVEEYDEKIKELLFAYSTDPGSLNTYKGYVIKPAVDGANQEEYVETFANAGRDLLNMGGTSYVIVASDFGYHVLFFSEVYQAETGYATLDEYLASEGITNGSQEFGNILADYEEYEKTDSYLYVLASKLITSLQANAFSTKQNEVLNQYVYNTESDAVKILIKIENLF